MSSKNIESTTISVMKADEDGSSVSKAILIGVTMQVKMSKRLIQTSHANANLS